MENKILYSTIIIALLVFGCKKEISELHDSDKILVLNKIKESGPFLRDLIPFSYVDSLKVELKGIPDIDSLTIQFLGLSRTSSLDSLLENGIINLTEKEAFINGVYGVSGISNGKHIMVIDTNNDHDFSNDSLYEVNLDIRNRTNKDITLRDSFPNSELIYNKISGSQITTRSKSFKIIPYRNYFIFKNPNEKTKMFCNLQLVAQFTEYWLGDLSLSGQEFKVAAKGGLGDQYKFNFQKKGLDFIVPTNPEYFLYSIKDTIKLDSNYIIIDSFNEIDSTLNFKVLDEMKTMIGKRKGEYLSNYQFTDINTNSILETDSLTENKKYLLIDFWGTWCAPCKELTPELKNIKLDYERELNVLSVAFDDDVSKVKKYSNENNMDWFHVFVNNKETKNHKNNIISELEINSFPTFILVDSNGKILYRGFGKEALSGIKEILKE